eukprot:5486394-Alexandrium_andersonii.AAC.1
MADVLHRERRGVGIKAGLYVLNQDRTNAQERPTQQKPDSDAVGINAGQARIAQGRKMPMPGLS